MASVRIHDTPESLGAAVADELARAADEALAARARFRVAFPGGRTPAPLFDALARGRPRPLPWARVEVFFADERAVPPDDPESNWRAVRESLLARVAVPEAQVHRMRAEAADLAASAAAYEALLAEPLDCVVLGLGEDGHVASLFPGSPLLAETARRVGAVLDSPKPPPRRLTLLPPALAEARRVLVLATGAAKADAVRAALAQPPDPRLPARLLAGREWHLDAEAAARLAR